jgi:hypothetical protein
MDAAIKISDFVTWWAAEEYLPKFKRALKPYWNDMVEDYPEAVCEALEIDHCQLQREAGFYYEWLEEEEEDDDY